MTWRRRPRGGRRKKESQVDWSLFDNPKGPTVRELKDAKQKKEKYVAARIRKQVFRRDPACVIPEDPRWPHEGPDEWAHMEEGTRARTRGNPPEIRHTSRLSCRLCRAHHFAYDRGALRPTFLTEDGADGPIEWRHRGDIVGGGR